MNTEEGHMTNNEERPERRKLDAAGWVVLLFLLAVAGGFFGSLIYLIVQYASTLGGAS
jgi:hypothetical protein